ncbi:hypothetical protein BJV78DRAFT_1204615 [Lactifluus subvellereus]|nr:hypothetical protein BJV78DRAFT_1204615 [Lactifluus subvellereus]
MYECIKIYQWPCLAWARGCWFWCWSTPWLVIHGSKDYRLPQTDGIGAFHALKQCAHLPIP